MRYFIHAKDSIKSMLATVEKNSLDDLFSSIPKDARLKRPLNLPDAMDELEIKRILRPFYASANFVSFLGAGATAHFVPEWVSQQLLRAEWYTSYTPYQPEASQGTLQAIFEFQSMVASLLGMEVANASMYDGATALVEALLMAIRTKEKHTVVLSKTIHPEYRSTVHTYFREAGFHIKEVGFDKNGQTDLSSFVSTINEVQKDLAAVALQSPNFFGRIEEIDQIENIAHAHNALVIGATTDMSSTGLLSSFGKNGADIVVGEGLGLVGGLSFGGPGVGLFACKKSLLRQMPGRLVGQTTDHNGRIGYVLTLSTREQHIRREKATSNICTNHNLMALAFSMSLAAYGKQGFINLGKTNIKKTLYFRHCLREKGMHEHFRGPHYNETVINLDDQFKKRMSLAKAHGIIPGLVLGQFYPELPCHLLVATTELHSDQEIRLLADILSGVHDG